MTKLRLNKILADAGIASRRNADILIEDGRVTMNGKICTTLGTLADPQSDFITVDGKPISKKPNKKITYLLNKPAGFICSCKRHGDDRLAIDLIKDKSVRLFTIGRLDKKTEGLILVTSDGDFANKVMHPSSNIEREYIAETSDEITQDDIEKIRKGTYIEGKKIKPMKVSRIKKKTVSITVMEGKKHEVRLLIGRTGHFVSKLKRVRIGSLTLGPMPRGSYRVLSALEKKALFFEKRSSTKKVIRNNI
ncbi:MAG: Ribosomal large subunit pseudouridine synthase B [Chlamydiia bacterium]|nr:Ribosomal large subunit pseudouridine synthase B [Chlamydiia bacterium]